METYQDVVKEAERILSLLQEGIPIFRHLYKACDKFMDQWKQAGTIKLPQAGLSHSHPTFKAMREEYAEILNKEKNINPKYSEFSNDLDEASKRYEYVRNIMSEFLGPNGVSLRLLGELEVMRLHKLFTKDEKFVEIRETSASTLLVRWGSLNLFEELREYVTRMNLLRKEMLTKLRSMGVNGDYN